MALEVLFSPAFSTYFVEAQEEQANDKYPLFFMLNYAEVKGKGHTTPGFSTLSADMKNMWTKLSITVVDEEGHVHESDKETVDVFKRPDDDKSAYRYGGDYRDGETLTVIVDHDGLPEGYHISNDRDDDADYAWTAVSGKPYSTFKIKFNRNANVPYLLVRMPLGSMDVKFDPQGGNWSGNTDPILKTVNKDNTVEFPTDPTKDNYSFVGWYSEYPDIDEYREMFEGMSLPKWVESTAKTRRYWNSSQYFSDYNRDWISYNSKNVDPLYDGIFLLRAEWKPLETYQLTFDPAEGHWADGSSEPKVYDVKLGEIFTIPEGTILSGSSFQYWEGSEYYPGDKYTVEGNHTFTAHYSETPIELIVRPIEPASTVVIPLNQPDETSPLPTSQSIAGQMPVDQAKQLPATGSVASGLSFMVSLGLIAWGLLLKK